MVAGVVAVLAASQIAFAANGAPTSYGDIYRVAPGGAVTNLTHDPAADVAPAASPDGKHVAFARQRATTVQVYVVGADGRGLRAVSPRLPGGGLRNGIAATIAWAPDSRRLVVELSRAGSGSTLYLTSMAGGWRAIATGLGLAPPAWSPDGRLVAATSPVGLVDVVDVARGRRVWRVAGTGAPAWSQSGLLAVHQNSTTIAVYDAGGHPRATFAGNAFAWSGDRLASLRTGVLELRQIGARPTVQVRLGKARSDCDCAVVWTGASRVRVRTADRWAGYDFATHRRLAGTQPFSTVWSATDVAAYTRFAAPTASLVRGAKVVRTAASCGDDDPFPNVQFVGRTQALVFQSGCLTPSADIYSIAPDGGALRRLTQTPTDEFSPTLSPDATRVAYSQQELATFCKGCPHDLWVTPGTRLTAHDFNDDAPFDDTPTFSPDGTQLAFVRSGPSERPVLYVMPAGGGPQRSLGVVDAFGQIAWGAQGIAYATGNQPALIRVVDPTSGAVKTIATEPKLDVTAVAWSSEGRLAYLATGGGGHASITVGDRKIALAQHRVTGLAWSPDGTRFAYVADDANGYGEVWTIGVDGTGVKQVTRNLGVVGTLSWR
jgi:Tol biopolymer transport system component